MKLEKEIENVLYDNGMNRKDSIIVANNVMSVFRKFIQHTYLDDCRHQNGIPSCKNCGLSIDTII